MDKDFKNRPRGFWKFPLFGLGFILVGGLAVMLLWNAIIPDVIPGIHMLNYVQAIGILVLFRILTGGKGRPGRPWGGPPWRQKMMNMTDEEREKFRNEWRDRCGRG